MVILILKILGVLIGFYLLVFYASAPRQKPERSMWRILGFIVLIISLVSIYSDFKDKNTLKAQVDKNSMLLQQVFELQSKCDSLQVLHCESRIEEETGYSIEQIKDIARMVGEQSEDFLDLGHAAFFLGNYNQAAAWLRKAAEQENVLAQFHLALMYEFGKGVKQDDQLAVEWLQKAAAQGLAEAQYSLGVRYRNGSGVKQDFNKAVEWYKKAAEQGLADAQSNLGVMYGYGRGVNQDGQLAVEWYQKAAEQGFAKAQFNLAVAYHEGKGIKQDFYKAVEWYQKAATQGLAEAQLNLGSMYHTGKGVKQDDKKARDWYQKAAAQGLARAQEALDIINGNK